MLNLGAARPQALAGVETLCFDLDGTFWDVGKVLDRAEARVRSFLTERYPPLAAVHDREALTRLRVELATSHPHNAHDLTWLRTEATRRLAQAVGCDEAAAEQAYDVFMVARNEVELFADVEPALERLATRYRLATLSNGNADLGRIGLASRFSLSLNARSVGHAKPHREAFASVLRALDLAPHQMAYIGDDPHLDVAGARSAGCRTVWIDRGVEDWPAGLPRADLEVPDLGALVEALLEPRDRDRQHDDEERDELRDLRP